MAVATVLVVRYRGDVITQFANTDDIVVTGQAIY